MQISLIVAAARNNVIGRDNGLPWKLSADLKRFKQLTMGHCMIMGRKTWDSMGGKPLPGRTSIVVSRQTDLALPDGVRLATSLEEALALAQSLNETEAFVIGGAQLLDQAEPLANILYYTSVLADPKGDVRWRPQFQNWKMLENCPHPADERNDHAFAFQKWVKRDEIANSGD